MSSPYITNSDIYQANAERDVFVILSKFNTEFIFDCIENALLSKQTSQLIIPMPNLVRSLEDNFIAMLNQFPDDKANIAECREETYLEIINYLCSKFDLTFNDNQEIDLYTAAYHLYDFLVNGYLYKLSDFFTKFILREKDNLYKSLNLDKFKKNTNINYGKKMFKDSTISTIIIQISYVIDQIMSFDFDFETIVSTIYNNNDIAKFILSIFNDNGQFFNFYKMDLANPYIRPTVITNIRLNIQNQTVTDDLAINNFIKEG